MKPFIKLILLLLLFVNISIVYSQDKNHNPDFEKLVSLYEKKKYETCALRAELMINSDEYKKSPEPYLYMGMSLYHIAFDEKLQQIYPQSYKNSFKCAAKVRTYDTSGTFYNNFKPYFDELFSDGLNDAKKDYEKKRYSRIASDIKRIEDIFPENYLLQLNKGICQAIEKDPNGKDLITLAIDSIKSQLIEGTYIPNTLIAPLSANLILDYYFILQQDIFKIQEAIVGQQNFDNKLRLNELEKEYQETQDFSNKFIETGILLFPEIELLLDLMEGDLNIK